MMTAGIQDATIGARATTVIGGRASPAGRGTPVITSTAGIGAITAGGRITVFGGRAIPADGTIEATAAVRTRHESAALLPQPRLGGRA